MDSNFTGVTVGAHQDDSGAIRISLVVDDQLTSGDEVFCLEQGDETMGVDAVWITRAQLDGINHGVRLLSNDSGREWPPRS